MNYQEKLALDFKNEDYQSVIDALKQNIEKGIDPLISSVELIYVHWFIVLEVREYPCCGMTWEESCDELVRVYNTYSPRWLDDAEFLFYTSYMGSCFCEEFIGVSRKTIVGMSEKAYAMHPDNWAYRWLAFSWKQLEYREQGREDEWRKENRRLARFVLADEDCVRAIKRYPLLGEDVLWLLDIYKDEED